MSKNIFFISDHHMGHEGPYNKFLMPNGKYLRDPFKNSDEADEMMIERHNKVVSDNDRVYFVGDFCFSKKHIHKAGRLRGKKVLIKGNHDILELKEYLPYFEDIRGVHQFDGMVITHIPVHEQSLGRWGFNVHGHLHSHRVMMPGASDGIDHRYFNVSVEQLDYTPISLEQVKKFKLALSS